MREVLNAMKVNRTFLCEKESLTADIADLMPMCTSSAEETLGMWLKDKAEVFSKRHSVDSRWHGVGRRMLS